MSKDLKGISEEYFNGVKIKHLKLIEYTTPKGNNVKAIINKASTSTMGSLYIYEVNNEETNQFVRSMPKQHYWDNNHKIDATKGIDVYKKLDGSCIIIYALKNHNGEIIEIVPKSRNMPTLDANLQTMYDDCDTLAIEEYIKKHDVTLFFELHGIRNKHLITEMETYCRLTLIGEISYDNEITGELNEHYPRYIGLGKYTQYPLFNIYSSSLDNTIMLDIDEFYHEYYGYHNLEREEYGFTETYDVLVFIKKIMDEVNEAYEKVNSRIALEGVVLTGVNFDGKGTYIKLKPTLVENNARSENGIPKTAIRKECYKFIDEYGSDVKEIYLNNPQMIWDYINHMLQEEYDDLWISKSQRKIKDTFCDVMSSKEVPESVQNICHKLVNDYPDEDVTGLIRIFAQEYPFMKKDARIVYSTLSMIKKE